MNFIIFNLADGTQKTCDFANLSQSLASNCEIVRKVGNKHEAIGFVSHKTIVHFAVEWADYALQNYSKKILPEAQTCIDLIRKWLEDRESVSNKELVAAANAAANAAAYAAGAAANAAGAAANAAGAAAYAANAAGAAANAAGAAAYAAGAAANAAGAAFAAGKNKLNEQNRQGNFILKFFEVE